jgi:hypothetical protein
MGSRFGHDIDFSCPHCGARYVVSYTELPIADSGSDYCECCKRISNGIQPCNRTIGSWNDPTEITHNACTSFGSSLLLHDADAVIAAGGGSHADLGVTIIRITPAPAFEQTVRSGDLTEGDATGQITARINRATSALAHV